MSNDYYYLLENSKRELKFNAIQCTTNCWIHAHPNNNIHTYLNVTPQTEIQSINKFIETCEFILISYFNSYSLIQFNSNQMVENSDDCSEDEFVDYIKKFMFFTLESLKIEQLECGNVNEFIKSFEKILKEYKHICHMRRKIMFYHSILEQISSHSLEE